MPYFVLSPEVPGGIGERSELVIRPNTYPIVERLHFEFGAGTLGNDLITSHPVHMVTRPLADALRDSTLTGFTLSNDLEVTVDDNVQELEPDWPIPVLEWLQVSGTAGSDDFGLDEIASLVVSDAALAVLRRFNIDYCEIVPVEEDPATA